MNAHEEAVTKHGFTAVPRNPTSILQGQTVIKPPQPVMVSDIPRPASPLVEQVVQFVRAELPDETFNHSMRVYYYGIAIAREQFPSWRFSDETYLLTCLLHDIGTTAQRRAETLMSFEFYGGFLSLQLLQRLDASQAQAESVAEAIIRHQDLGDTGTISTIGQLIQLATVLDNTGAYADLVHQGTIDDVTAQYPRHKWSSCFAATIVAEVEAKPWCHTTALEGFREKVLNNQVMEAYEL
ncbi:cyanamide hydratase [Xylona heveae TC161]|uniref:Cyanamide hydratase n=1 Tax=Xylona heveae (strain CBS 132557 / TC161) TaxID=1328760 RepID=A0A165JJU1_XYLHT|nr:cyanamide hydratase [Xylona heveae TC161]KZF26328.1 cyanamide hydratase [Xylona heveae TC161]